jgi:hypothetical protein
MRKLFSAGLSLGLLLAGTVSALAATTGNTSLTYGIIVNIAAFSIDLQGATTDVSWGTILPGSTVFSNLTGGQPRSTITQNGYATVTLAVSATVTAVNAADPSWALTPNLPTGINQARLSGIFTLPLTSADAPSPDLGHDLVATDFGPEDVITGVAQMASNTVFSRPGEAAIYQGFAVTSGSPRSLRYMLNAPLGGSTIAPQRIAVTISGMAM